MAAGKHGASEITVTMDDTGGTPRTITSYVLTIGAAKLTANMQANTPMGATFEAMLPTGTSKVDKIAIHGYFDDTATSGPHVVFAAPDTSPQASTRTLAIVFGNSKTFTCEGYVESYAVLGKAGNLTEFEAVYQPNSGVWS